jgi:hypothetical protein
MISSPSPRLLAVDRVVWFVVVLFGLIVCLLTLNRAVILLEIMFWDCSYYAWQASERVVSSGIIFISTVRELISKSYVYYVDTVNLVPKFCLSGVIRWLYSRMLHCVVSWKLTDVSEVITASFNRTESTPETSVNFYQSTRRNNREDSRLRTRRHENLKPHLILR